MLSLSLAWTHETGLPTKARIPGSWDTSVPVISGTHSDTVCSFLPYHWPGEQISVPGCDTSTGCFADSPERPEHGSRLRAGTRGRDFGDPGACLHRYTPDGAHRSVGYAGYVPTLAPMGKSIV